MTQRDRLCQRIRLIGRRKDDRNSLHSIDLIVYYGPYMSEELTDRIKIAYVINDLKFGGAQRMLLELTSKLDKERFVTCVYYLNPKREGMGHLGQQFEKVGVKTICVNPDDNASLVKTSYRLYKMWQKECPDIVHAHLPFSVIASGLAKFFIPKIRFIIHEHQASAHFSWKIRVLRFVVRPLSSLALSFSEDVEKEISGESHVLLAPPVSLTEHSYTIRNGVDVSKIENLHSPEKRQQYRHEFLCNEEEVLIMSVARLLQWKGQRTLLDAFSLLRKEGQQVKLCLVGSGPDETFLRAQVTDAGLDRDVVFAGDREDALELLCAADIFSLVFNYEGEDMGEAIGVAGFEALAAGLPVLATSGAPIISGLENESNILLIKSQDPQSLAASLRELIMDASLRRRIGAEGKAFARRNLDWQQIVPVYEKLYSLVINI
jgi:glycosyltransferase involved in cell wall biosynthesis